MQSSPSRDTEILSAKIEWPTWILLVVTYTAWIALTLNWESIPGWAIWILGGYTTTLHSSLQHEAIHGHPTRNPRFNLALVWPPLLLWLPVEFYHENHLRHHRNELTNPDLDPESFFVKLEKWQKLPRWRQWILLFNNTFAGRMLIGPWLAAGGTLQNEFTLLHKRDYSHAKALIRHAISVAAVLYWVLAVCNMPLYLYLLAFVWPGTSMMMIRSFLEHRYDPDEAHRTVLVDGCPLTRLLFLNNNYHWIHHRRPELAWYRIPAAVRAQREEALQQNGNYTYPGYWTIAWRYLFRPWTHPAYPPQTLTA